MKTVKRNNNGTIEYKIVNFTSYHAQTPQGVIEVLDDARINRKRLRLYLGDVTTGLDWMEECDTTGYIGRSGGTIKVPLLVYNERSYGGGAILDHCIVKIKEAKGNRVLYQAPNYHQPKLTIVDTDMADKGYTHNLLKDGKIYARLTSLDKAQRLLKKLS